jgi:hypothetical protein
MDIKEFNRQVPPYKLIKQLKEEEKLQSLNVVFLVGENTIMIHGTVEEYHVDDDSIIMKFRSFETGSEILGGYHGTLKSKRNNFRVHAH